MKRLIWGMFALLCILTNLAGCKSANYAERTPYQTSLNTVKNAAQPSPFAAIDNDQLQQVIHTLTANKAQLQAKIDQQSQTIEELTKSVAELKNEAGVLDALVKEQPWLKLFRQPGSLLTSVKVSLDGNSDTSVTVIDPVLLNAFSGELYVGRELFGLNSGGTYNSDILPCNYQVKLDNGLTYGITVPTRGVLIFDQLANHNFETSKYIHQLCKALVKKPAFIPDLPLFAKMADSGLLFTKSDGVYYYSANRIQGLIYAFIGANKSNFLLLQMQGRLSNSSPFIHLAKRQIWFYSSNIFKSSITEKKLGLKLTKVFHCK
jgi:hypothetical protein